MNPPLMIGLLVLAVASSWILTRAVISYAVSTRLLDLPNGRSSHTVPTPRGGGLAIVAAFAALCAGCGLVGLIEPRLAIAVLGAGLVVAALGFIDDRRTLPARVRFLGHTVAAAWVLWWMNAIPPVPVFGHVVNLGLAGPLLGGLFIVWAINLFNFMDGIDGIAGIEAVTVTLAGALLWAMAGHGEGWIAALLFAGCVMGFLLWNLPPAAIFLGDVGSGFIGLVVATFALWCGQETPQLFWSWFILIGCFMVDATTTLVRRVRRGERFFEAHRTHAYQYASRLYGRHLPVSLAVGAINLLWLLPIAVLVSNGILDGVLGVLIAYAPLVSIAFKYHAGDRAAQRH